MRPLFMTVLMPSTPMKDERLWTAGSFRMTLGEGLLEAGHFGERDAGRCFRNAENDAGILHGEETLRHDNEEKNRDGEEWWP